MSYWDSSALLKLYATEVDSAVFEAFVAQSKSSPVIGQIGFYEMCTALHRKEIEGALTVGSAQKLQEQLVRDAADGSIRVIEFSTEVEKRFRDVLIRCFSRNPPLQIRTLDALHVSFALAAGESEMVVTDKRLREAASYLALKVFP